MKKVFISATWRDLVEYHQAVKQIILSSGMYPLDMETFNPSAANSLQICYNKVQEADIFIGFYAYSYGSIPKKTKLYINSEDIECFADGKRSFTHYEYSWAHERKMPLYLFFISPTDVHGNPLPWSENFRDKPKNASRLAKFKKLLENEHTVGSFYSADNLASKVAVCLSSPELPHSPEPRNPPPPLQLPSDILPEKIFLKEDALSSEELSCVYEDKWVDLPEGLEIVRKNYIEKRKLEAQEQKSTFDDNPGYSLSDFSVNREKINSWGNRIRKYSLFLRPTTYYFNVFPNLVLDKPLEINGIEQTPREFLDLQPHHLRFEDLSDFKCHFYMSTATVFITSDQKIILSIRSKKQEVVSKNYHLSAAEGMLRSPNEISPFQTSIRSLQDELGLKTDRDFEPEQLRCLGFLMDTLRAQPLFVFYIRSSQITFDQVYERWKQAPDKHENKEIIGVNWSQEKAEALLNGQPIDYHGTNVPIASNHAQAGLLLAARHEFW